MTSGSGDVLARGASRATYAMPIVSQAKWDAIFADDALEREAKAFYASETAEERAETRAVQRAALKSIARDA